MKLIIKKAIIVLLFSILTSGINSESMATSSSSSLSSTVLDLLNNVFEPSPQSSEIPSNNLGKNFRFMRRNNNSTKAAGNSTASSSFKLVDLNNPNSQLNGWMTISSPAFANRNRYPQLVTSDGVQAMIDLAKYERVNSNYASAKTQGAPLANAFWFKVRGGYIYYSSTKEDINVLDAIFVKEVKNNQETAAISNNNATCFEVLDYDNNSWKLCAQTKNAKLEWMCSLLKYLKEPLDYLCIPESQRIAKVNLVPGSENTPAVDKKKVVQPVIVIPMSSKQCNDKWDYVNRGNDWECTCKEGLEQSPIDLPSKDAASLSSLKPMFQYEIVSSTSSESTFDGLLNAGENVKIRYDKGAIRIYHSNMGKIIALDGGVYVAEEISFHTPSEHKINGQQFDMEMQVVHYGRTKGDIAKQIVFSFLFKKSPGVYNKFIDRLDFFNLPNPTDNFRDLIQAYLFCFRCWSRRSRSTRTRA